MRQRLALLAKLGTYVRPVGNTSDDVPGDLIRAHLAAWGGDVSLILTTTGGRTRGIVEIAPPPGSLQHRFRFTCLSCGKALPSNSNLRAVEAHAMIIDWSAVDLYFFDRASPGNVFLAAEAKRAGVTVMFEPPKSHADSRMGEAVALADIV